MGLRALPITNAPSMFEGSVSDHNFAYRTAASNAYGCVRGKVGMGVERFEIRSDMTSTKVLGNLQKCLCV